MLEYGSVCLLHSLEQLYDHPTTYVHFYTESLSYDNNLYGGYVKFSNYINSTFDSTPAGTVNIFEQLDPKQSILEQTIVNPFLEIILYQIQIQNVLLQGDQVYLEDYASEIKLVPSSPGVHMPYSLFSYMNDNFLQWICTDPDTHGNWANTTSLITPLYTCQCEGSNFYGMPELDLHLIINGYPIDYAYVLKP